LVSALKKKNILSSIVGEVTDKKAGLKLIVDGKVEELKHPKVDPYWIVMEKLLKET
jgi:hydrogenase maturation factor